MKKETPEWVTYRPLKWVAAPESVNASRLSKQDKQQLWRGIQAAKPELATMLQTDETLKLIMREFNASLTFEKPEFETLMAAGNTTK